METLAIVLAILMVGVLADPDYTQREEPTVAALFLGALGCAIYVAVAG